MNRTDAFARDLCQILNQGTSKKYVWKPCGKPAGRGHESVDVVGWPNKKKGKLILVEPELRRDAPLTNPLKIWKWAASGRLRQNFILIQAFSKYYRPNDTRRANAEFVGHKMEESCGRKYLSLPFDYKPYKYGKLGAGRRRHHAILLARKIVKILKQHS